MVVGGVRGVKRLLVRSSTVQGPTAIMLGAWTWELRDLFIQPDSLRIPFPPTSS